MQFPDVNVLVYAHRTEYPEHEGYRRWLLDTMGGTEAYAVSNSVLSGFIRVVTNPRIFRTPTSPAEAVRAAELVRGRPNCVSLSPGGRHWNIFARLCQEVGARGNVVPDAYLAALAIEHGCEFVTADRGFARFPGLRWRYPLD